MAIKIICQEKNLKTIFAEKVLKTFAFLLPALLQIHQHSEKVQTDFNFFYLKDEIPIKFKTYSTFLIYTFATAGNEEVQ